jgi:hypothetical protein
MPAQVTVSSVEVKAVKGTKRETASAGLHPWLALVSVDVQPAKWPMYWLPVLGLVRPTVSGVVDERAVNETDARIGRALPQQLEDDFKVNTTVQLLLAHGSHVGF